MPQYEAMIELSDLDGQDGFRIDGGVFGLDDTRYSVASAGDINGDGFSDLVIGSKFADPNGIYSGASWIVFGKASGFGATFELSSVDGNNGFQMNGEDDYGFTGTSVSSAGDINGDGFADLVVGAYGAHPNGGFSGASYVVFGKASGFDTILELSSLDGNNGFRINGEVASDRSGISVSSAQDVNGDGLADLIIGADGADPNGGYSGASYVVFGRASGFGATFELSSLDGNNGFQINGEIGGDEAGRSVSLAGDVNNDGFSDVVIGAGHADPNGTSSGASYVVFGKASGFGATLELSSLDGNNGFQINGEAMDDLSGGSVSAAGDVNGDGWADLIFGALGADPNGNRSGASYIVFGKATGFGATLELSSLDGNNGFQISGEFAEDKFAISVASAGDFNGDGFADLIVGAVGADHNASYAGTSYVVFGKASGFGATFDLSSLDGNNGFEINGEGPYDASGLFVSSGDVNGDGFADVMVGDNGTAGCYVIFGSMPDEAVTRVGTAIANTIHGGKFDDTLNGVDGNDTLIGHNGNDSLRGGANNDLLDGGKGKDNLFGGLGADTIDGGTKADKFIYGSASNSTSTEYDTVVKFDFAEDRFDTPVAIAAIDGVVSTGILRKAHFDDDLGTAVGGAQLGVNHAVLFTPDVGNLAGKVFLVLDLNGTAGYQAGVDLVLQLNGAQHLNDLGTEDFI